MESLLKSIKDSTLADKNGCDDAYLDKLADKIHQR
jgi:hypothetical protein